MPRSFVFILVVAFAVVAQAADIDRVLRRFDFEERAAGNVEDVPMDWVKLEGPGLPHYVNGSLTTEQAVSGRYSFGFRLDGGSLIYRYPAGKIKVHPATHYRLGVLAKTQSLVNARVQMTAYFADQAGKAIRSSVVRSEPSSPIEWTPIGFEMTAPQTAASLVVELGLVQSSFWRSTTAGEAAINEQDIDARAWFDDLTVAQIPQMQLATTAAGNVFRRNETVAIDVTLNDRVTDDLVGRLSVNDADGRAVYQKSGNLDLRRSGPSSVTRLAIPALPAGWYRTSLSFESGTREVARQTINFVQLPDDATTIRPDARFGVSAADVPFDGWDELPKMLPLLGVSRVKVGVWTMLGDIDEKSAEFDRLVERLRDVGITPTGCLNAPPPVIARRIGDADWSHLNRVPAEVWRPKLEAMVAKYAGRVSRWQLGADGASVDFSGNAALRGAYAAVLEPMSALLGRPDFAMPWPVYADPATPTPAALALFVPTDVLPQHLPLYVGDVKAPFVSLSLKFLDASAYGRAAQLRDLAQRIGYAIATNVQRIDVPNAFEADPDAANHRQPSDTFLATRTMFTTLAGATFQGRMPLGDDVEALLFDKAGEGILLAWTKSPQAVPRVIPVMLGRSPRMVDLNGNVSAVLRPRSDDGTTDIVVGPTPSLVIGIDGPLARLRSSFAFDNAMLESSYKPHVRRLTFSNPYPTPISGRLRIVGPAGWTLTPQTPSFAVPAGGTYDGVVTIEFPFSSVAGVKPVELLVQLEGGESFKVPLTFRLGLSDLGVETAAFRDGPDVVVQQMITNYGSRPADYTAFAAYPGAARQERIVAGLLPGTTVVKRYRFNNVDPTLAKAVVRSGVRESQGTRSLTDEVTLQ